MHAMRFDYLETGMILRKEQENTKMQDLVGATLWPPTLTARMSCEERETVMTGRDAIHHERGI